MKKILVKLAVLAFSAAAFSQELSAKKIADNAIKKESPQEAAQYVAAEAEKITVPVEKRAAYAFLGSLQEATADFNAAQKSFAKAAGIATGNAEGMPKKSSERLVIDAIRCALSGGDWETAENYLNSAVRNSKSAEIQATIKLYEQWAILCKAQNDSDLKEPCEMLKTYANLESMKSVKPSVLLTLWYITAENSYADLLNKEFPASMETGIVNGKVQVYPAPFWYFLPRKTAATPKISTGKATYTETKSSESAAEKAHESQTKSVASTEKKSSSTEPKAKRQQLGLFRDKANAQNFAEKVNSKGFKSYIQTETKSSGTTYFLVVVDENIEGTMGIQLKNAGFECYPVF